MNSKLIKGQYQPLFASGAHTDESRAFWELKSVLELRYLAIDFDRAFCACQGVEELFVILKALDGMSQ
jgi:hypothetical protein